MVQIQKSNKLNELPARKFRGSGSTPHNTGNINNAHGTHANTAGIVASSANFRKMLEELKPHDHLCLIYESPEEWRAAVIPFISIGLKHGQKCIYVVDTSTADQIFDYLGKEGIDVSSVKKSGQLSILHETEAYTREGSFDPDRMIALLISETEKAISEGYSALRVTGEMSWALRGYPGSERLLEYEAKLNQDVFPKYPCLAICQYDRWKFNPEIIKGVVMTHPFLVRGNQIFRNFYYIPPDEFLNKERAELEVKHWLNNLERETTKEQELRQSEDKYRSVVERANDGICIIQDKIVKYANARLAEIRGGPIEEIIGTPFVNHIHPDELPKIIDRYNRRMAGEQVVSIYETVLRHNNGSRIDVELNVGITDYQGKPAELVIIRDITERRQSYEKLQRTLEATVQAMATIAETRDPYTAGHQKRVGKLACAIAKELGLSEEKMADIRTGAILHDIGKMYIPSEILSKPGKLSEIEFSMIKAHPQVGYDIVKKIEFPCVVAEIVLQHHERLDGSGYPQGLSDDNIVLEAKILAVADVVEAMASHRPYRPALGVDKALEEISQNKGKLYDNDVVNACLRLFQEKGFKLE